MPKSIQHKAIIRALRIYSGVEYLSVKKCLDFLLLLNNSELLCCCLEVHLLDQSPFSLGIYIIWSNIC